ncbi:MAG: SET domain-containing protein-lysine N-methyltransferase [Candidatus Woesearchaeota archaeon]
MDPILPKVIVEKSRIHATGVYADQDIKKGQRVIEYVGDRITKEESEIRSERIFDEAMKDPDANGRVYIFTLDETHDIDGSPDYNRAKYINHSCSPNCEADIIEGRIWILATKDIKQGEELTYNYGYDLDDWEEHPCFCGTPNCIGYIAEEDLWPKLRKMIEKKKLKTKG